MSLYLLISAKKKFFAYFYYLASRFSELDLIYHVYHVSFYLTLNNSIIFDNLTIM